MLALFWHRILSLGVLLPGQVDQVPVRAMGLSETLVHVLAIETNVDAPGNLLTEIREFKSIFSVMPVTIAIQPLQIMHGLMHFLSVFYGQRLSGTFPTLRDLGCRVLFFLDFDTSHDPQFCKSTASVVIPYRLAFDSQAHDQPGFIYRQANRRRFDDEADLVSSCNQVSLSARTLERPTCTSTGIDRDRTLYLSKDKAAHPGMPVGRKRQHTNIWR